MEAMTDGENLLRFFVPEITSIVQGIERQRLARIALIEGRHQLEQAP